MKPILFRLIGLILTVALGVAVSSFANDDVSDPLIAPLEYSSVVDRINYRPLDYPVVISVPADNEVYIGKRQVDLSQISAMISRSLGPIPQGERVAYIKSAARIKFETLDIVIKAAKQAGIDRIEFMLDKKKSRRSASRDLPAAPLS